MDAELARSIWRYEPETGLFYWLIDANRHIPSGAMAGAVSNQGYRVITYRGKKLKAARLAWLLMVGAWPKMIDHIDTDKSNDKMSNLRECNHSQNLANVRVRSDNPLGVKGVVRSHTAGKYVARIAARGRRKYLGTFSTIEAASLAYDIAARAWHGEFARST